MGVKIVSRAKGPVVVGMSPDSTPQRGQVCFTDVEMIFERPGGVAFSSNRGLYLNNVYVKNAAKVARHPDGAELAGNPNGWVRVGEYAHGPRLPIFSGRYQLVPAVYIDGVRRTEDWVAGVERGQPPPATLQWRHLWDADHPNWQSPGAVNVKAAPYFAKGDGKTDDTEAIQRAVDGNGIVLLPKGRYRLTKTLRLRPETKLVGVGQHLSLLMVIGPSDGLRGCRAPACRRSRPRRAAARCSIRSGIFVAKEAPGAYALDWRCGPQSVLRTVTFQFSAAVPGVKPPVRNTPLVKVSGAGRWYNFYAEFSSDLGPGYRHLLVENTAGPLAFYQCNAEHARGEANMEIRNARHVSIYGLKGEGNFRDSVGARFRPRAGVRLRRQRGGVREDVAVSLRAHAEFPGGQCGGPAAAAGQGIGRLLGRPRRGSYAVEHDRGRRDAHRAARPARALPARESGAIMAVL